MLFFPTTLLCCLCLYKSISEAGQVDLMKHTLTHLVPCLFLCEREEDRAVSGLTNDDYRQGLKLWRQQSYHKHGLATNKLLFPAALHRVGPIWTTSCLHITFTGPSLLWPFLQEPEVVGCFRSFYITRLLPGDPAGVMSPDGLCLGSSCGPPISPFDP